MKTIFLFIGIHLCYLNFAQQINWHTLDTSNKHLVLLNTGWDYGIVFGAGYGYQIKAKIPMVLIGDFSMPSGKQLDDFKIKSGITTRLYKIKSFQLSAGLMMVYRKYENPLVKLNSVGSEFNLVAGYYRRYFIAGQFGFDKSIATHFNHKDAFRENIYQAKNRWYKNTGELFSIGIQTGYSFKKHQFTFRIGKVFNRDFKTSPLIPYYLGLAYCLKIG